MRHFVSEIVLIERKERYDTIFLVNALIHIAPETHLNRMVMRVQVALFSGKDFAPARRYNKQTRFIKTSSFCEKGRVDLISSFS